MSRCVSKFRYPDGGAWYDAVLKHSQSNVFQVSDNKYGQISEGWLEGCEHVASPNYEERPLGSKVELVVVHNISLPPGEFGGPYVADLFTNSLDPHVHPYFEEIADLRVSAHFLIRRDGDVVQFVSTQDMAWHAGVSQWRGREKCNEFSLGIELEGTDTHLYTQEQYARLEEIIRKCRAAHPGIEEDAIVGHSDIASGRKTDPGESFDWQELQTRLGIGPLPRG